VTQDPISHAWQARLALEKARAGLAARCAQRETERLYTAQECATFAILAVLEWVVDEVERARTHRVSSYDEPGR
jgi:hypothetical protein